MTWNITDETHREIFQELESQSDRGAAIIGTTLLEERLEEAIRRRLHTNNGTEKLFEASGSATTFSAKIDLAFSVGLYGTQTYHDLHLIRKIRNEFAHFVQPLDFGSERVAGRCRELWFPQMVVINGQPLAPKDARAQYLRAINILNSLLWTAVTNHYVTVSGPPPDLP